MLNRFVWLVGVGAIVSALGCAVDPEGEAIETATSVSGLACLAWTPIQTGTLTIGANHFGVVTDGNFTDPFPVDDGYAFKIKSGSCIPEEVKIFAHNVVGGPEVELSPVRSVIMPDGNRIWVYKPNFTSTAFNITNKVKGTPGTECEYMTMTCTTD